MMMIIMNGAQSQFKHKTDGLFAALLNLTAVCFTLIV